MIRNSFEDEDAAVEYAIHCQRDRRNLSDADMLRWIKEVDKRKTAQERAAMGTPAREGNTLASCEAKVSDAHKRKSAQHTADVVGTSRAKVEKARAVLDKASDEVKQAVEKGEMSINQAYNDAPRHPQPFADLALRPAFAPTHAACLPGVLPLPGMRSRRVGHPRAPQVPPAFIRVKSHSP